MEVSHRADRQLRGGDEAWGGVRGSFREYLVRPKVLRKSSASEWKRQKGRQEKIYAFLSQADPTGLHSSPRIKTLRGRNSGKERWVILLKEYSLLLSLWHAWLKVTKGKTDHWINSFMFWVVSNVRAPPRLSLMGLHRAPVAALKWV